VFVFEEFITQSTYKSNGDDTLKETMRIHVTCHRNESFRNKRMKRGKPHKLATQILVGACVFSKEIHAMHVIEINGHTL